MLSFLVVIACLPLLIESSNLALTFDANNSVCTASCTTCSSDTTPSLTGYNHTFIMELLNATMSNGQAIKETKEAVDGIIRSLSLIKDTITTNAGAINDILLLVVTHPPSLLFLPLVKRLRTNNQTVLLVCIYWQLAMELHKFTVIWRSFVVQEEDGQD